MDKKTIYYKIRQVTPFYVTDLPDFMYFIDVNILGSQHVHSIC